MSGQPQDGPAGAIGESDVDPALAESGAADLAPAEGLGSPD